MFWFLSSALKTNKSVAKRFKVKGNGDLLRCVLLQNEGIITLSYCNILMKIARRKKSVISQYFFFMFGSKIIPHPVTYLLIRRRKAGKAHNTGYKSRGRVNRLASSAPIKDKAIEKKMKKLLNF